MFTCHSGLVSNQTYRRVRGAGGSQELGGVWGLFSAPPWGSADSRPSWAAGGGGGGSGCVGRVAWGASGGSVAAPGWPGQGCTCLGEAESRSGPGTSCSLSTSSQRSLWTPWRTAVALRSSRPVSCCQKALRGTMRSLRVGGMCSGTMTLSGSEKALAGRSQPEDQVASGTGHSWTGRCSSFCCSHCLLKGWRQDIVSWRAAFWHLRIRRGSRSSERMDCAHSAQGRRRRYPLHHSCSESHRPPGGS